jgi:hypothetical protein
MAKNIERLAEKLGAQVVGELPEVGGGAFGAARLGAILRERLEPSPGKRPGRPTNLAWDRRPKVPMSAETEARLAELAAFVSGPERKISPMQVAAEILEHAVSSYFRGRTQRRSPLPPGGSR